VRGEGQQQLAGFPRFSPGKSWAHPWPVVVPWLFTWRCSRFDLLQLSMANNNNAKGPTTTAHLINGKSFYFLHSSFLFMVIKKIGKCCSIQPLCLFLFMAQLNVLTVEIIDSLGACCGQCENVTERYFRGEMVSHRYQGLGHRKMLLKVWA